jgi:alkyl sulfatase BDS1-like metallo-beta-lactamase superfamily hydrolase
MIRAMSTDLWLDFLGVRLDSSKAEGVSFVINFATPDNGEKYVVELSNSTLTNVKGFEAEDPDLAIEIDRVDLEPVMMGVVTLDAQIEAGKAKLEGDRKPYEQLKGMLVHFTPDFEMMPGTKPSEPTKSDRNPFEQNAADLISTD